MTALNIAKELEAFCNDKYHLLSAFEVYGIAVMYSEDKLIAWIRSNGFMVMSFAGALDKRHLEEFREHLGNIVWR